MFKPLLFMAALVLLPMALIYPAWCRADRRHKQGVSILFLPLMGVGLWGALIYTGLGAQSLGNLVEAYVVCALGVGVAYAKFHWLDRQFASATASTGAAYAIMAILVTVLRVSMPLLPE